MCEGGVTLGEEAIIRMGQTCSMGNSANTPPVPQHRVSMGCRAAMGPTGGISAPMYPHHSQAARVQALGVMQEGLLRNVGIVSVLEITAFGN